MTTAGIVAAVEAAAILALVALWWRAERRRVELQEQVFDLERRSLRVPRGITAESAVRNVWEVATAVRDKGLGGAFRASIGDLVRWAEVERPELADLAGDDGCVAIWFCDIVGSTELNERLGDRRFVRFLAHHDALVARHVARHDGRVVKNQGDGYLVAFATAEAAVRCAIAVQRAIRRDRRSQPWIRIGIHHGRVVTKDDDIFGRNVALAARVQTIADPGTIMVSEAVLAAVADVPDLVERVEEPFVVELKGIRGEQVVAEVRWR